MPPTSGNPPGFEMVPLFSWYIRYNVRSLYAPFLLRGFGINRQKVIDPCYPSRVYVGVVGLEASDCIFMRMGVPWVMKVFIYEQVYRQPHPKGSFYSIFCEKIVSIYLACPDVTRCLVASSRCLCHACSSPVPFVLRLLSRVLPYRGHCISTSVADRF